MLLSLVLAYTFKGTDGVKECFNWFEIRRNFFVACGIACTQALHVLQLSFLSPGETIVGHVRLLLTALASKFVLGELNFVDGASFTLFRGPKRTYLRGLSVL